jgi:hypothetical protein
MTLQVEAETAAMVEAVEMVMVVVERSSRLLVVMWSPRSKDRSGFLSKNKKDRSGCRVLRIHNVTKR